MRQELSDADQELNDELHEYLDIFNHMLADNGGDQLMIMAMAVFIGGASASGDDPTLISEDIRRQWLSKLHQTMDDAFVQFLGVPTRPRTPIRMSRRVP